MGRGWSTSSILKTATLRRKMSHARTFQRRVSLRMGRILNFGCIFNCRNLVEGAHSKHAIAYLTATENELVWKLLPGVQISVPASTSIKYQDEFR